MGFLYVLIKFHLFCLEWGPNYFLAKSHSESPIHNRLYVYAYSTIFIFQIISIQSNKDTRILHISKANDTFN